MIDLFGLWLILSGEFDDNKLCKYLKIIELIGCEN